MELYYKMVTYINLKSNWGLETIDEFDTRKEAFKILKEYRLSDNLGDYYLSSRCCNNWRNK